MVEFLREELKRYRFVFLQIDFEIFANVLVSLIAFSWFWRLVEGEGVFLAPYR